MKHTEIAAAMLAAFSISACVLEPVQDQFLAGPYEVIAFGGFAHNSGATVVLEARNQETDEFEEFATVTANTQPVTLGKRTLFYWHTTAAIAHSGDAKTLCRWHKSCQIQPGDNSARVRAREVYPDGTLHTLFTHQAGGVFCMYKKLEGGEVDDLYIAYWLCKPDIFYSITLNIFIRWR